VRGRPGVRGRVADVMTPEPFTVRDSTNLEAAARILLRLKVAFASVNPVACWLCTRAMPQRDTRSSRLPSAWTRAGAHRLGWRQAPLAATPACMRGPGAAGSLRRLGTCAAGWLVHGRARAQIRRLPVVDEEGRLVGMFTRSDVIRAALRLRRAAQDLVV